MATKALPVSLGSTSPLEVWLAQERARKICQKYGTTPEEVCKEIERDCRSPRGLHYPIDWLLADPTRAMQGKPSSRTELRIAGLLWFSCETATRLLRRPDGQVLLLLGMQIRKLELALRYPQLQKKILADKARHAANKRHRTDVLARARAIELFEMYARTRPDLNIYPGKGGDDSHADLVVRDLIEEGVRRDVKGQRRPYSLATVIEWRRNAYPRGTRKRGRRRKA